METLEKRNRKRRRKENLQKAILSSVATAGILAVGLVAPNVIKAMNSVGILPNPRRREYVSSSASKLAKKGLLKFENGYYQITKEGKKILSRWELADYKPKQPRKWDHKWRILIYDISEKKAIIRRQVGELFKKIDLYRLQDSVWVYPYDCEEIIGLLKTELGVGKEILYIIADEIENDRHLRSYFSLIA